MKKILFTSFILALALPTSSALAMKIEATNDASFTVDATAMQYVTPDFVKTDLTCEWTDLSSKTVIRREMRALVSALKQIAGSKGSVSETSQSSIWESYSEYSVDEVTTEPKQSGTQYITVKVATKEAVAAVQALLDKHDCYGMWYGEITDTTAQSMTMYDELTNKIADKLKFYEKLFGKTFSYVNYASLYSYADSYDATAYNAENHTVRVTTTLSLTFSASKGQ